MKLQLQAPSIGAPQHPQPFCASLVPKQALTALPCFKIPLLPHPNLPAHHFCLRSSQLQPLLSKPLLQPRLH
jgi:hypothetical protein